MTEVKKEENVWLKILKSIPWLEISLAIWKAIRPKIEKKVIETGSRWDDGALAAVDLLVDKFLKEDA